MDHVTEQPTTKPPIFKWNAVCVQALLYPIAIVIYLLIGAAVFTAIEFGHEKTRTENAIKEVEDIIEEIMDQNNLSQDATMEILNKFTYLCEKGSLQVINASYEWDFVPSFFFAATVVTAIGN